MALHAVSPAAVSSPLRALSRRLTQRPGPLFLLLLPHRLPRRVKFERLNIGVEWGWNSVQAARNCRLSREHLSHNHA
jgi:hypothetical protein